MSDISNHIAALSALVETLTHALAGQIQATGGDADAYQNACYELAFAAAETGAAEAMLDEGQAEDGLSEGLSDAYIATVLPETVARLHRIAVDLDSAPDMPAGLATAFMTHQSSAALAATGAAVLETGLHYRAISTDPDTDMARDSFYRLGQDIVAPLAERIHREDLTIPEAILTPLREMGTFGLSIPEAYGGIAPDEGENTASMIAITEALSTASLGAAGSLITRPEILSRAMLYGGTEAQKKHWLPKIAAGEPLCAISITEPDFGSDAAALSLKAVKTEGGWLLNGAKTWCTFAGKAGLIMVVARTGEETGHKGLSILLVEKPSTEEHSFEITQTGGGRMTGKAIATIGYRGMHSYDMAYENFFVPDENVLGEAGGLGKGFYMTMAGMTGGRIQTAARACGLMAAAIDAALQYAGDRKVFGQALGSYQLTQARLAGMAARYRACRALSYNVAAMIDRGEGQMQASLVKLLACRSAEMVTRDALQIFGGMGYAEETPVSRYFVDARVLSIFEGAEETLAMKVVARELLRRANS